MPRQTRLDARYVSKLAAAAGQDRLHGGDGVMTRLRPSGRLVQPNSSSLHQRAGAANDREVRRAQHLAPGDQTRTCFPPPLPPQFG